MEYALILVLAFGFLPFFLNEFRCYKSDNPGLSYIDKSVKTQMFILSKNMVVLILAASIWFCRNHSNIEFCNKILLPLKIATALFIAIKILPNNYSSHFQFALESGVKNYKKFSYCYGRFFEILFLVISIISVGVSVLGIQLYYLVENKYDASLIQTTEILQEIKNTVKIIDINRTKLILENLNSCAYSSLSLIIIGITLTICFIFVCETLYIIEWKDIKTANKNKSGIIKTNNDIFNKRQFGVFGALLLCVDLIVTYIFYNKVLNATSYLEIYRFSNIWYYITNIIFILISIVILTETLKIIIKLMLYYRHKRKVIQAIAKQECINQGKCTPEQEKYKGYDFTSKLLDYQFNVFRFMFEPKVLKNKPATIKNIKEMVNYVDELKTCKICIFMGIPLISTNNLFLSYKCFKAQMKYCDISKKDSIKNC